MKYPAKSLVLLLAAALMPSQVSAQLVGADETAAERRPYRGIFGSFGDPNTPQSLMLNSSLFGGYDDDLLSGEGGRPTADPSRQISGVYGGAQSNLSYKRIADRFTIAAQAGAMVRYYPDQSHSVPVYHESFHLGTRLWSGAGLNFDQRFVYSPNYRLNMFVRADGTEDPDAGIESDSDLDLSQSEAYRHAGGVSFSQDLGPRTALHASYNIRMVDFVSDAQTDFRTEGAAVGFSYRMNSHVSLRLGYGRRWADHMEDIREVFNLDIGLDYSKAVSLSRRTRLSFSTGSAISASDRLESEADPRTRFHVIGAARLVHELGRSWTAGASYRRSMNFREGFDEPLMADAVTGTIGGLISRETNFHLNVAYVNAIGVENQRTGYEAFTVNTQLQYALNRYAAMFVRYFFYDYNLNARSAVEQGVPPAGKRSGVRFGITTTLPLIR
jgi:hypothetical protein